MDESLKTILAGEISAATRETLLKQLDQSDPVTKVCWDGVRISLGTPQRFQEVRSEVMNRRYFLKSGSIALASVGMSLSAPAFLERVVLGNALTGGKRKTLIAIFQRGAVDGLNMVVPFGESNYYSVASFDCHPETSSQAMPRRRSISTASSDCIPSMSSFKPLWDSKRLAIIHASGSPDNTRSHFDAQDYMESATPGVKSTSDGWLNRYLQSKQDPERIVVSRRVDDEDDAARASGTRAGGGDVESVRLCDSRRQVVGEFARRL